MGRCRSRFKGDLPAGTWANGQRLRLSILLGSYPRSGRLCRRATVAVVLHPKVLFWLDARKPSGPKYVRS